MASNTVYDSKKSFEECRAYVLARFAGMNVNQRIEVLNDIKMRYTEDGTEKIGGGRGGSNSKDASRVMRTKGKE